MLGPSGACSRDGWPIRMHHRREGTQRERPYTPVVKPISSLSKYDTAGQKLQLEMMTRLDADDVSSAAGGSPADMYTGTTRPGSLGPNDNQVSSEIGLVSLPMALSIECIIPGKESETVMDWMTRTIFYELEKEYGRNAVLSYDGDEVMKFKNALKLACDLNISWEKIPTLTISTERQLRELQLRKQREAAGEAPEEEPDEEVDAETNDVYPIRLQGNSGKRTMTINVSASSTIGSVLETYCSQLKLTNPEKFCIYFDGDIIDSSQTIGDCEIEEGYTLDVSEK